MKKTDPAHRACYCKYSGQLAYPPFILSQALLKQATSKHSLTEMMLFHFHCYLLVCIIIESCWEMLPQVGGMPLTSIHPPSCAFAAYIHSPTHPHQYTISPSKPIITHLPISICFFLLSSPRHRSCILHCCICCSQFLLLSSSSACVSLHSPNPSKPKRLFL